MYIQVNNSEHKLNSHFGSNKMNLILNHIFLTPPATSIFLG